MGYNNPDLYYQPEKFGLTQIGEIEWSDECYQFDKTVVWKHEDGRFFLGEDAGCSCPSPFENFFSLADAQEMTKQGLFEYFETKVREDAEYEAEHKNDPWYGGRTFPSADVAEIMSAIAQA